MDVEMEKRKFLNLCGKRDQALLSGEKRMTLGDMELSLIHICFQGDTRKENH